MKDRAIVKRRVRGFFVGGLATYGTLRAVASAFAETFSHYSVAIHTATIVGSIASGLWQCKLKTRVTLKSPLSDSSIEVVFGDIFDGDEVVVIPVNEYFDGELGDHVSDKSLHGKFINKMLGGKASWFYNLINEPLALKSVKPHKEQRNNGRNERYPIGTVLSVDIKDRRFLLAVLSRTNLQTLKAVATIEDLMTCLNGIWKEIQIKSNGRIAKIPLIGSGLSGVGLPPNVLIDVILTSYFDNTKSMKKIADKVVLVLNSTLKGEIDLTAVKRKWS